MRQPQEAELMPGFGAGAFYANSDLREVGSFSDTLYFPSGIRAFYV